MVRGLAGFALLLSLVAACTTFGVADTGDDGGVVPSPSTSESARPPPPPIPRPDGAAPLPIDGGPRDAGSLVDAVSGPTRRIALVFDVPPTTAGMDGACSALGSGFGPFVARGGMLPSQIYAPDNRPIVRYHDGMWVARSLKALEADGAANTILVRDGGAPSSANRVWTGLGQVVSTPGNTCMNWTLTGGTAGSGSYNMPGRSNVFLEDKNCELNNTLMAYCVER